MPVVVEKQVQIAEERARQLEQLAIRRGTTENALIEVGLDLLFRQVERGSKSSRRTGEFETTRYEQ